MHNLHHVAPYLHGGTSRSVARPQGYRNRATVAHPGGCHSCDCWLPASLYVAVWLCLMPIFTLILNMTYASISQRQNNYMQHASM